MIIKRKTSEGLIKSIFNFEVDNKITRYSKTYIEDRKYFWDKIYVKRELKENAYEDFINSQTSSLLILVGHVGSGKSTFIRHKFEKLGLNNGLIIDFRGKNDYDKCNSQEEVDMSTYKIIKDVLFKSLFENIKINLYKYYGKHYIVERDAPFIRYDYNLSLPLPSIDLSYNEDSELKEHVDFQIAIEIVHFLKESGFVREFRKKHQLSGFSSLLLRKKIAKILENNISLVYEIYENIEWNYLLTLYKILFDINTNFILVFDNFDVVPLNNVKNYFLETLIKISNFLNGNIEIPFQQSGESVKLIFTIRDENISRFSRHNRAAFFEYQIIIGNDGFLMPNTNKAVRIPIDSEFCYEIIKNRIAVLEKNIDNLSIKEKVKVNYFIKINEIFWINNEEKKLRNGFGFIDIRQFSNDSIRLILDYIAELTMSIILKLINNTEINNLNYLQIKGMIINELWAHKSTQKLLNKFKIGVLNEITNENLCIYRLIISYLYNRPNNKATTKDIWETFNKFFDYKQKDIINALLDLYNSDLKESELISIYYNDAEEYSENNIIKISENVEIKLNQKGVIFIEKIILHPDYFGKIIEEEHGFYGLTHLQLSPKDFIKYYEPIFNLLKELSKKHIRVYQTLVPLFDDYKNPFDKYKNYFTIKSAFYLERVCDSHKNHIKNYIIFNLYKENNKIMKNDDDKFLELKLNNLTKENPLRKIWYKYYKKITPEIQNILKKERENWYYEK